MNEIRQTTITALGRTWEVTEIGAPVFTPQACHALADLLRCEGAVRAFTLGLEMGRTCGKRPADQSPVKAVASQL